MTENDRKFTGWAFVTMFVLAFIYMGALSAALEGWELAYTILSWTGLAILIAGTVACVLEMFKTDTKE